MALLMQCSVVTYLLSPQSFFISSNSTFFLILGSPFSPSPRSTALYFMYIGPV